MGNTGKAIMISNRFTLFSLYLSCAEAAVSSGYTRDLLKRSAQEICQMSLFKAPFHESTHTLTSFQ